MKAEVIATETVNEAAKAFYLEDEGRWFDLSSESTGESVSGSESRGEEDEEKHGHHESWHSFQTF